MPRKTSGPRLVMPKAPRRRTTYAQRTGQTSRAVVTLVAALNDRDLHWDRDAIRQALLRQRVVTVEELTAELPRAAIGHAVAKGWLHRQPHEDWLYVTRRAADELKLPGKTGEGVRIRFLDAAKLPPSAPAFPEAKKVELSETRAAELVAAAQVAGKPTAEAKRFKALFEETGWAPVELARRIAGEDKKALSRWWNLIIYRLNLLTLAPEYQRAADAGTLSTLASYELFRVPADRRARLYAAIAAGELKSRSAIKKFADALIREGL